MCRCLHNRFPQGGGVTCLIIGVGNAVPVSVPFLMTIGTIIAVQIMKASIFCRILQKPGAGAKGINDEKGNSLDALKMLIPAPQIGCVGPEGDIIEIIRSLFGRE